MAYKHGGHKMKKEEGNVFIELMSLIDKCSLSKEINDKIILAGNILLDTILHKSTIYTAGNGGSAAQAQHFSAELVGRYLEERRAVSSICLNTDTSILTSLSNDYDFSKVFERQIEAHGSKDDALLAFSTSGKSKNIIRAINAAKSKHMTTVILTGETDEDNLECDVHIQVPSKNTPLIQTVHMHIMHSICNLIERRVLDI